MTRSHLAVCLVNRFVVLGRLNTVSEAIINTRALCLYLLIVAAWRRAVLCALAAAIEKSKTFGNPTSSTDPYTNSDMRVYDANGNLTSYTDKRNYTTSYTYDDLNRRETEVAPLPAPDNTTTWTYDYNGNTKTVTDRLGEVTTYFYDGMNRLVRTRNAYSRLVEEIGYDGEGNRLTVTDAWTNTVVYSYTRQGQVSTITKPDNGVFTYEYDLAGNVTRTIDEEGADTRFEYDVRNRVWRTTYAYGMPYEYQHVVVYDENGRTVSFTDGEGCVSETTYDPRGLVATTDYYKPDPNAIHSMTTKRYDAQGNLIYSTDPLNNTTSFDYDMMNRNWQVVKPSGATFTKSYDPNGNVSTETDGENNTMAYTYNSKGWCTQTTDAAANNFDKTYDAMGRVATETVSPDGGQTLYTTSYTRDALGNPTAITDPLNNTHLNFYDTAGRLDYYIDRNGNTVGFTYNNMNKADQISHPAPLNSNSASSTTINYTLRGDMSYYTSPEVNKEFAYDALRRKTLEGQYMPSWPTVPPGGMLYAEFGYDKRNRMTYTMDFSGMETVTVYDDVYQTKTVTDVTNNQTTNIGYDPAGNMTTKTSPNGLTDNYTYDTDNRLSYQEIRDSNNTLMGSKAYTYNDNSQINWDSASGYFGNYYTDYTFNNCRLLATEVRTGTNGYNKSYTYDGMYNRTVKVENGVTTTYSYNGLGRITQSVSNGVTTTYTYDNNGNLISKSDGTNTETYEHDWKNNMVHYTDTNGNKDVYYGYDIGNVKIVKAWEASEEEQMSSMTAVRPGAFTPRIVAQVSGMRTLNNPLSPGSYNTCADITGRKFYYHKLQISNVCDARTDILDTSSWDNDSSWIWEQAFFNDFASGMSLTEYEETTARKTGVGPYTVHYDGWGSMAVQTMGNAATWQMLECDAVGVVTASQAIVGSSLIGVLCSRTDYFDWYGNEYGSGKHNVTPGNLSILEYPDNSEHHYGAVITTLTIIGIIAAIGGTATAVAIHIENTYNKDKEWGCKAVWWEFCVKTGTAVKPKLDSKSKKQDRTDQEDYERLAEVGKCTKSELEAHMKNWVGEFDTSYNNLKTIAKLPAPTSLGRGYYDKEFGEHEEGMKDLSMGCPVVIRFHLDMYSVGSTYVTNTKTLVDANSFALTNDYTVDYTFTNYYSFANEEKPTKGPVINRSKKSIEYNNPKPTINSVVENGELSWLRQHYDGHGTHNVENNALWAF